MQQTYVFQDLMEQCFYLASLGLAKLVSSRFDGVVGS
jgi:hypothetical protein